MTDLSIIIISFNTKKFTKETIDSVIKHTKGITYEIIVVDNASSDGSKELLQDYVKRYENVVYIQTGENLGFGRGNNVGIEKSKGKYILLLNSDTKLKKNIIPEMIKYMDSNPKIGVSTCSLLNTDGSLQGTGGGFPTLGRVFAWMLFIEDIPFIEKLFTPFHPIHTMSFYKGGSIFKEKRKMDWITGAFMLIRRKVIEDAGIFDEAYFMYVEETELCYRIAKSGWEIWYLPEWSIIHYGGASGGGEFSLLSEYKGVKLFYKKHMNVLNNIMLKILLKLGSLIRIILFTIIGKINHAKIYVKAFKLA
ncbi:MAG: glycosyltransferase family 2 protein [Patescibacteria group bacterium]